MRCHESRTFDVAGSRAPFVRGGRARRPSAFAPERFAVRSNGRLGWRSVDPPATSCGTAYRTAAQDVTPGSSPDAIRAPHMPGSTNRPIATCRFAHGVGPVWNIRVKSQQSCASMMIEEISELWFSPLYIAM